MDWKITDHIRINDAGVRKLTGLPAPIGIWLLRAAVARARVKRWLGR